MKKLRKVDTAKRKEAQKDATEELAKATEAMMNHPKECCVCARLFERSTETVKSWMVTIREERVRLTCPNCWDIINEALRNLNVENKEK